jgi:hypothetical protein
MVKRLVSIKLAETLDCSTYFAAPTDNGYIKIYSTKSAFVALKADGSITAWGRSGKGGTTPTISD